MLVCCKRQPSGVRSWCPAVIGLPRSQCLVQRCAPFLLCAKRLPMHALGTQMGTRAIKSLLILSLQTIVIALAAGLRILPTGLHSRPAEYTSLQILRGYEGPY